MAQYLRTGYVLIYPPRSEVTISQHKKNLSIILYISLLLKDVCCQNIVI